MTNAIHIASRQAAFQPGIDALRGLPASVVSDVLGRMPGTCGLRPVNRSPVAVCGNALTVKVRSGDNLLIHKALQLLQPGDVLVVDGEGDTSRALFGEIMMTVARARGAVGVVLDGAVRDVDAFEEQRFPCWARGVNLRGPYKEGPGSINQPITVGGALVQPGDVVLGDSDGLVFLAPSLALEAARLGREKVALEKATIASILAGRYDDAWVEQTLRQKGA